MTALQEKMLELLKEIDAICRENKIDYFLQGGTTIGAVRHQGFIPWDDDLDIIFTRNNWNKFKQAVKEQRPDRHLSCIEFDQDYYNIWAKYVDPNTTYIFPTAICGEETIGCFIDIGILDALPQNEKKHKQMIREMVDYGEYINHDYYITNRKLARFYRNQFWSIVGKLIGRPHLISYFQHRIQRYNLKPHKYLIQNSSIYPVFWKKEYYETVPQYVPFEDTVMPIMQDAGSWLRDTYGDDWYMIPSIAERSGHGGIWTTDFPANIVKKTYAPYLNVRNIKNNRKICKKYRLKAIHYEDTIRILNSKKLALADGFLINRQLETSDIDLFYALHTSEYQKILEHFKLYLEKQFQHRYISDQVCISIDINFLFIICMTLTLTGKYYKAQKLINLNFKSEYDIPVMFKEVVNLIEVSRELSIAVYDKNDWEKAKQLIEDWKKQYPHHIDFCAAEIQIKLTYVYDPDEIRNLQKQIATEIKYHPNSSRLKKLQADAQLKIGEKEEAYQNYKEAYQESKNGMLRLGILNIAKKLGFEIVENSIEDSVPIGSALSTWTAEESVRVQEKIYELLTELDNICQKEQIPYFLGGYLAAGAEQLGGFISGCCSAYVVMHPKDRKRFLHSINKYLTIDRVVESFENNPNYPDFSIRYTNTSTLFFDVREEKFYKYPGISIIIYFIRPHVKSIYFEKFCSGLYAAVEANVFSSIFHNHSSKKVIAGFFGKIMMIIIGKRLSKYIIWKIIYELAMPSTTIIGGSIKSYWLKKISIPEIDFSRHSLCRLNGLNFPIPINYEEYIKYQIKANWKKDDHVGIRIKLPYISDVNLSCKDYTKKLKALNIRKQYCRAASKLSRLTSIISPCEKYLYVAWNIAKRGLDYITLWKKYIPQKPKIQDLYEKGDMEELEILLQDYIQKIEYYSRCGLAIAFDNDILRITWFLMDKKGKSSIIERMLPKMPKAYYQMIKLSCGEITNMKQAEQQEQKMILLYLEKDIVNCLYMYADIEKYGTKGPNISVWYDMDEVGIRMVVMKYHSNFQIYTNRGFDNIKGLLELINQEQPISIAGREEIIRCLDIELDDNYQSEYGVIFKGKTVDLSELNDALEDCTVKLEQATDTDAQQIAQLICLDDELGQPYTEESLTQELEERMKTGMGRSYVIRDGNRIVAHNATYAECSKFVVISGFMVHPNYRNTEYAYWIDVKSGVEFQEEGKDRYFLALKKKIIRWHKYVGSTIVARYGKLSLRNKSTK